MPLEETDFWPPMREDSRPVVAALVVCSAFIVLVAMIFYLFVY